jgi:hypothetical protein
MISWHRDKFHDFLILFVFYIIFKQLDRKFTDMFREHGIQNFWSVPKLGRNLCPVTYAQKEKKINKICRV